MRVARLFFDIAPTCTWQHTRRREPLEKRCYCWTSGTPVHPNLTVKSCSSMCSTVRSQHAISLYTRCSPIMLVTYYWPHFIPVTGHTQQCLNRQTRRKDVEAGAEAPPPPPETSHPRLPFTVLTCQGSSHFSLVSLPT